MVVVLDPAVQALPVAWRTSVRVDQAVVATAAVLSAPNPQRPRAVTVETTSAVQGTVQAAHLATPARLEPMVVVVVAVDLPRLAMSVVPVRNSTHRTVLVVVVVVAVRVRPMEPTAVFTVVVAVAGKAALVATAETDYSSLPIRRERVAVERPDVMPVRYWHSREGIW